MESQPALVGAPAAATAVASEQTQKFSLFALTAMVVGSVVGAVIFSLRRTFGKSASGRLLIRTRPPRKSNRTAPSEAVVQVMTRS